MIERVARALYELRQKRLLEVVSGRLPVAWEDAPEVLRAGHCEEAKVAIEAMREPTEEMLVVVRYDEEGWAAENWRAMVAVALDGK